MADKGPEPATSDSSSSFNPAPLDPPVDPRIEDAEQTVLPALGAPGQPVVQVNVEEDMEIGGGSSPVDEGATDHYGLTLWRTVAAVLVAAIVAVLLAFPVLWGLVELFALAGVVGPVIWGWVVLLIGMVVAVVVLGYRIARTGF
jgi:hypothetical protein